MKIPAQIALKFSRRLISLSLFLLQFTSSFFFKHRFINFHVNLSQLILMNDLSRVHRNSYVDAAMIQIRDDVLFHRS